MGAALLVRPACGRLAVVLPDLAVRAGDGSDGDCAVHCVSLFDLYLGEDGLAPEATPGLLCARRFEWEAGPQFELQRASIKQQRASH